MDIESLRPYINEAEALPRVANNKKLYRNLLGMFARDNAPKLKTAEQCLAAGDIAEAAKIMHALKGVAANLALTDLFEKITVLEGQLKQGVFQESQLALVVDSMGATLERIKLYAAEP